jgi:hypothetical protein
MQREKMSAVSTVISSLPGGRRRDQRLPRPIDGPLRPAERRGGRAWINGREVGGTEPRHAHLAVTRD